MKFRKTFINFFIVFFFSYNAFAEISYQQILDEPANLELNLKYAKEQADKQRYKQTIGTLERLTSLYPTNLEIKLYLLSILLKTDSYEKVLGLIEDIKSNNQSNEENKKIIEEIIAQLNLAKQGQQVNLDWNHYLDLIVGKTFNSNINSISNSKTLYINNYISNFASNEIEDDELENLGVRIIGVKQIDQNSGFNYSLELNKTEQRLDAGEELMIRKFFANYNKVSDNHYLSPYIYLGSPNYKKNIDYVTKVIGLNNRYIINDNQSLLYGVSLADTVYNNTPVYVVANYKNNNSKGVNLGYEWAVNPENILRLNFNRTETDARADFNSFDSNGVTLSYIVQFPIGVLQLEHSYKKDIYLKKDSLVNSSIDRTDNIETTSINFDSSLDKIFSTNTLGLDSVFFGFSYKHQNSDSSLLNYQFEKDIYSVNLVKRFKF